MTATWTVRRSRTDAKLTGLCGGVAEHWGIDPVLVRLGMVLLALSSGIGIVLYLAGWLLVPAAGKETGPIEDFFGARGRRWPKKVWVSLVVVATVVVFALFGSMSPFGLAPAVLLAMVWYFGFSKKGAKAARRNAPAPPEPGPPTPTTFDRPDQTTTYTDSPAWPTLPAPHPATVTAYADPPPREPLPREAYFAVPDPVGLYTEPESAPTTVLRRGDSPAARRLRLLALVAVGLTLAGLGVADNLGRSVPLLAYLAAPLLVLGLTLVAATWVGRARGILPVAILLAAVVLATVSMPAPVSVLHTWPATNLTYTDATRLPTGDKLDVGHLRVDLSRMGLTRPTTYRARVDAGQLEVVVPPEVNVVVNYRLDAGVVQLFGKKVARGTELHDAAIVPTPAGSTRPTLTLDVSLDVGTLKVHR